MTQAFNLALLGNKVNTSGQLDAATGLVNATPVANGGTGLSSTPANGQVDIGNGTGFTRATLSAGTGISISNGAGSITISNTSPGTVTSIATGNGLAGGTITTSGTLTLGSVGFNTVGSYAQCFISVSGSLTSGNTYAAGNAANQVGTFFVTGGSCGGTGLVNNLSGTWRFMAGSGSNYSGTTGFLFVRVA